MVANPLNEKRKHQKAQNRVSIISVHRCSVYTTEKFGKIDLAVLISDRQIY